MPFLTFLVIMYIGGFMKNLLKCAVFALITLTAVSVLTGCPNSSTNFGSTAPTHITSGDYTFVKVPVPAAGIVGADPTYALPETTNQWKGVFRTGRTVRLSPYMLGKNEVTYGLWYEVLTWAESKGYVFTSKGQEGSMGTLANAPGANKNHPVTKISWRDCIIWCNAYTEKTNGADSECVYRKSNTDSAVLKDATDAAACDTAYADTTKKGFRLPTEAEWEFAARLQNNGTNAEQHDDVWLTKLDSASGAKDKWDTAETDTVAWHKENSGNKTHAVGEKRANVLGLNDMSGNVWEWCFDQYDTDPASNDSAYTKEGVVIDPQGAVFRAKRVVRGNGWGNEKKHCALGYRSMHTPDKNDARSIGFRLAQKQ